MTNSSDQINIVRSSMRKVARPASAFGFCTTTSVMCSIVPSGTVYVASPSLLSVTWGASVWENSSPATAAVVGPGELVTVGATVVGAVLVVAGRVVALATVVVTTSVSRWSTASSAASSIAGLTKPNQPSGEERQHPDGADHPAPQPLRQHRCLYERAAGGDGRGAGLLGVDAERQRAPPPFPLPPGGAQPRPHQHRAAGIDADRWRLELGFEAAGRVHQSHPAARLHVAAVLQCQLVGRPETTAQRRLQQREAAVAHRLDDERDRRFEDVDVGTLRRRSRIVSPVGPAAVPGRRGGRISTSTSSCVPGATVIFAGRSVTQPAARPVDVRWKVSSLVAVVDDDDPLDDRRAERDVDLAVDEPGLRRHGRARYAMPPPAAVQAPRRLPRLLWPLPFVGCHPGCRGRQAAWPFRARGHASFVRA